VCHARLHKKLVRVLLGFRLGLGETLWGAVLIHLQTLFQLQVGVSAHETLDKVLTDPVLSCPRVYSHTLGPYPSMRVSHSEVKIKKSVSSLPSKT
jgi:hypothetical protein